MMLVKVYKPGHAKRNLETGSLAVCVRSRESLEDKGEWNAVDMHGGGQVLNDEDVEEWSDVSGTAETVDMEEVSIEFNSGDPIVPEGLTEVIDDAD